MTDDTLQLQLILLLTGLFVKNNSSGGGFHTVYKIICKVKS